MNTKTYPLLHGAIKKKLQRQIIFYLVVNASLLIGLALTEIDFFKLLPLFFLMFSTFTLIPTFFGSRRTPIILSKSELDHCTYEMMIPSMESWIRNTHFLFRMGIFLFLFMVVFPILNIQGIEKMYYLAFIIYGTALWRYLKIYKGIEQHFVEINDQGITFPVFGFLKNYRREVSFEEIRDSKIYGSWENIEMTCDEDLDRGVENLIESGSTFMQGLCLEDTKKRSYIFSSLLIATDDLYKIWDKLPGDEMQLINEFN